MNNKRKMKKKKKWRNQEGSCTARHQLQTSLTDPQVSKQAAHGTPIKNPGTNQHSPLNRLTPTQGMKGK
jgi:hypothetical protein